MNFLKDLYNSLNNTAPGFSAKKLSALVAIALSVRLSLEFTNSFNLVTVLTVWLGFALFCLGFIKFAELIQLRTGQPEQPAKSFEIHQETDIKATTDGSKN